MMEEYQTPEAVKFFVTHLQKEIAETNHRILEIDQELSRLREQKAELYWLIDFTQGPAKS